MSTISAALPEDAEWDERELVLLNLARRQADDTAKLELLLRRQGLTVIGSTGQERLNPLVAELRQQRLTLARLLAEVRLPDEGIGPSRNVRKVRAAQTRWARADRRREVTWHA